MRKIRETINARRLTFKRRARRSLSAGLATVSSARAGLATVSSERAGLATVWAVSSAVTTVSSAGSSALDKAIISLMLYSCRPCKRFSKMSSLH